MSQDEAAQTETGTALVASAAQPPARAPREIRVVEDVIPVFDTAQFEHMVRIAELMASGQLLPESLCTYKKGEEVLWHDQRTIMARAFMIVNQAKIWKADPNAIAQATSFVHNKLCYEGKLVHALIESRLGIRLDYEFGRYDANRRNILGERNSDGEWIGDMPDDVNDQSLGVRVVGKFEDEIRARWIAGSVGMWHKGPRSPWGAPTAWPRQLRYMGAREWCRAYQPSLMLGILTDDEIDHEEEVQTRRASRRNEKADIRGKLSGPTEPAPPPAPAAPRQIEPESDAGAKEGFDQEHVDGETGPGPEVEQTPVVGDFCTDPNQMYGLAADEKNGDGRWPLYQNGLAVSSTGDKGRDKTPLFERHPPKAADPGPTRDELDQRLDGDQLPDDPGIRTNPEDRRDGAESHDEGESSGQQSQAGAGGAANDEGQDQPMTFPQKLAGMTSWLQIKAALGQLRATEDWAALEPEDQNRIYAMAWAEAMRVKKEHRDPVDQCDDPTAFRCWVETLSTSEHADAIDGTWAVLIKQPKYTGLKPEQKASVTQVMEAAKLRCNRGSHPA